MYKLPLALAFVFAVLLSGYSTADLGYQMPPKIMADLVDAPRRPGVTLSDNKQWLAILHRPGAPSISDLAQPEEKLAGLRINANVFGPSRSSGYTKIEIRSISGDRVIPVDDLPEGKVMSTSFSPDSKHLAYVVEDSAGLTLWSFNLEQEQSKRVADVYLNASLGGSRYLWKRDSSGFYTRITVANPMDRPTRSIATAEPIIQVTSGEKAAVRTYSNLLKTPYDAKLFEFLTTSQMVSISLNGKVQKLGRPAIYSRYSQSPDGNYLLVSQYQKPFSYLVPASRFPMLTEIWTPSGDLITQVADLPSGENIPKGFDSVIEGRRNIAWRGDLAATLFWAEAQDGGDMAADVDFHDAVYIWSAPFKSTPKLLQKVERRFAGIEWGNSNFAVIGDWRFSDRQYRAWKFSPDNPLAEKKLFQQRSYNDRYNDPGNFVTETNKYGVNVIKVSSDNTSVFLTGNGASPEGNIPFMDTFDFSNGEKQRLWQSEAPYYERIVATLDQSANKVLTLREAKTEQPNFFVRDLKNTTVNQFTQFPHPSPAFANVSKETIKYQRSDGVDLSGTLYLPPDYDKSQGPLPVLMWAYPLEYKDKAVASQVTDSPYEFVRVSYWGPLPHLSQGFAVFDDPKMPIIGADDNLPNDSFRQQLIDSAQAAVDELVERGIADPDRIAIAGHSYGAFMVANLLAHSDLFAAGIARSGAYNRTLTPFGFQGEERSFWEGQSVYATMSPFFHAEKINEPMLMIHGKEDPNSGTFPMQSERMFAAMKGLGGNARLVMLPHEQHGYRARESLMHLLWEQQRWLDKFVAKAD